MNNKQKKALTAIIEIPVRSDIRWDDIESLLQALGADISAGSGSRVRCSLNGVKAIFHRPHPEKTATKGTVEDVATFLRRAGVIK